MSMEHARKPLREKLGILRSYDSGEDQDSTLEELDTDSALMLDLAGLFQVTIRSLNIGCPFYWFVDLPKGFLD